VGDVQRQNPDERLLENPPGARQPFGRERKFGCLRGGEKAAADAAAFFFCRVVAPKTTSFWGQAFFFWAGEKCESLTILGQVQQVAVGVESNGYFGIFFLLIILSINTLIFCTKIYTNQYLHKLQTIIST